MVADFEKKQKRSGLNKKFFLATFIIFLVVVCGLIILADIKIYERKKELTAQLEILKKQVQDLKNNNVQLEEGISNSSSQDYIEKVAREQLDLQKKNEKVAVFLMPEDANSKDTATQAKNKNWFLKFIDWVKSLF